jgi:hypothetical protein
VVGLARAGGLGAAILGAHQEGGFRRRFIHVQDPRHAPETPGHMADVDPVWPALRPARLPSAPAGPRQGRIPGLIALVLVAYRGSAYWRGYLLDLQEARRRASRRSPQLLDPPGTLTRHARQSSAAPTRRAPRGAIRWEVPTRWAIGPAGPATRRSSSIPGGPPDVRAPARSQRTRQRGQGAAKKAGHTSARLGSVRRRRAGRKGRRGCCRRQHRRRPGRRGRQRRTAWRRLGAAGQLRIVRSACEHSGWPSCAEFHVEACRGGRVGCRWGSVPARLAWRPVPRRVSIIALGSGRRDGRCGRPRTPTVRRGVASAPSWAAGCWSADGRASLGRRPGAGTRRSRPCADAGLPLTSRNERR